jgi:integrase
MKFKDIDNNYENKISFIDYKNKEVQHRKVNKEFINILKTYAINSKLTPDDFLFTLTSRNISMILKRITDYLGYTNIGTHSFRKFYAINAYKASNNDLEFVRSLLNHSSVSITQRYLNSEEKDIDEYSSKINMIKEIY